MNGVEILDSLDEWDLVMRQLNRSGATRKVYATAVRQFDDHQRARADRPPSTRSSRTTSTPTSSRSSTAPAPRRR